MPQQSCCRVDRICRPSRPRCCRRTTRATRQSQLLLIDLNSGARRTWENRRRDCHRSCLHRVSYQPTRHGSSASRFPRMGQSSSLHAAGEAANIRSTTTEGTRFWLAGVLETHGTHLKLRISQESFRITNRTSHSTAQNSSGGRIGRYRTEEPVIASGTSHGPTVAGERQVWLALRVCTSRQPTAEISTRVESANMNTVEGATPVPSLWVCEVRIPT